MKRPSALGLGCARFGSITSTMGFGQAQALVRGALDAGVQIFDTADIYGQGDSERWLGRILAGDDRAIVWTKAGQMFSTKMQAIRPLKGLIAPLIRSAGAMRRNVAAARSRPLALCFEPGYLQAHAQASLKRLRRERLDAFFLHNATVEAIARGEAVGAVDRLKQAGQVDQIGVSTDDPAAARAALGDARIDLLQIPLGLLRGDPALGPAAEAAKVSLILREVFGGVQAARNAPPTPEAADAIIRELIKAPGVGVVLVGTTRLDRLRRLAAAAGN